MNNKKLGNNFENMMCEILAKDGWWVHFLSPDRRGAQPFDIIAVRAGLAAAIDCKTCEDHIFRLSRLEDNQINAFEKWRACGNAHAYLAVLHDGDVYLIPYEYIKEHGSVDLDEEEEMKARYYGVSV